MIPVDKNCVQKFDQYSQYLFSIQTYVETSHAILNILCFDFFHNYEETGILPFI